MIEYLRKFENVVVATLILMLAMVILLSVAELGWVLIKDIIKPPMFILELRELLELFGLFLLVLTGIELLETMKNYFAEGHVDPDAIISVSPIAIGRKIIIMEPKEYDPLTLLAGYWVFKKTVRFK